MITLHVHLHLRLRVRSRTTHHNTSHTITLTTTTHTPNTPRPRTHPSHQRATHPEHTHIRCVEVGPKAHTLCVKCLSSCNDDHVRTANDLFFGGGRGTNFAQQQCLCLSCPVWLVLLAWWFLVCHDGFVSSSSRRHYVICSLLVSCSLVRCVWALYGKAYVQESGRAGRDNLEHL